MRGLAAALLLLTARLVPARAAAPTQPPAISRVRLSVKDLPGALAWLDKVMGWTPSYRDERRAVLASSATVVELDAAAADSTATIALVSADVDADYGRLLERGAVSLEAPADRPAGDREAFVRGPAGLVFELDGPAAAPAGFSFTEIAAGTGETPRPTDTVKVRYVGALLDGTVFDAAHRRGRAEMIPLPSAIACWARALPRMRVGGKGRFVCPPAIAYGKAGRPPRIPPDATLVFDVELAGVLR